MANRIKGITIEIGGDSTKLTDALKRVDDSLKDTQAQLKDVNRLLKLDPSNVELLRQKQELLGKATEDTRARQKALKEALEELKKAGDTEENRRQQDLLQRELIETTAKLGDLEKEYKKCSPTLQSISTKTGQLAEQTKGLSTAAGIAAGGMVAMAVKAGQAADDLLTMSRSTGLSVEELQKMQYAADRVDVSYETMTSSIVKLTKQIGKGNEAFEKLGIELKDQNGETKSATDIWYEAIEALAGIENEADRDVIAMELFGKSSNELKGIIDDGGQALRDLGAEAENAGLIMSGDAVKGAGAFNDALDELKAKAAAAFTEAGATLAETLVPALEKLIEVVSGVLSWFANLDGDTQTLILTILALVAAISPVLGLISTLTALAAGLNVAMLPLIGTIGLIVAAIGALVYAGVYLYNHWEEIKEKAAALWAAVKETFEDMKKGIIERWESIKTKAAEIWETVKQKITEPIEKAKEKVRDIIEKIKGLFRFDWELPHIKLPHIALTPPGWKIGDLLKGSVPKIGIEWYAKAMDKGMILDGATVFGEQNGKLLAGGEAGREVVIGENALMRMIREAAGGTGNIEVNVTVNGNVDDYDEMAEAIGQKLQQQMARAGRAFGV